MPLDNTRYIAFLFLNGPGAHLFFLLGAWIEGQNQGRVTGDRGLEKAAEADFVYSVPRSLVHISGYALISTAPTVTNQ